MIADSIEGNREMKRLMMLVVAVAAAMTAMAETETVGGYVWHNGYVGENVV